MKILVCGSAGFLMSNFLRYVIYRTKDFQIISVDKLEYENYNELYKHKLHRFYLGDLEDKTFVNKLISLEKPDYIINSISYDEEDKKLRIDYLNIFNNLFNTNIPLIQIIPSNGLDKFGLWSFLKKDNYITRHYNGAILELCNCFGLRQKYNNNIKSRVVNIIKDVIEGNEVKVSSNLSPWIFSEDIGSLLWYLVETKLSGYFKMPALGHISLKEIAQITLDKLDKDNNIKEIEISLDLNYQYNNIDNWIPDSISLRKSIEKTISWYDVNRWAIL